MLKSAIGKEIIKRDRGLFSKLLIYTNLFLFHRNNRRRVIHPGNIDPDKYYYVIRPNGKAEGLLSCWFGVLYRITWAYENGYIPYVDFSGDYKDYCQYYVDRKVAGTNNAWEYYFTQPTVLSREELYQKKNVILGGWKLGKEETCKDHRITSKYVKLIKERNHIKKIVDQKENALFSNDKVLGVFIRGTDYVSIRPKNHPVQPSVFEMIEKVNEVVERFNINKIYLVTEDKSYYTELKAVFGDKILTLYDTYVEYKEGELLQELLEDDPYERGLHYLVRVLLLNRCRFLVSSVASGSKFAKAIRDKEPEYEYWFELGEY